MSTGEESGPTRDCLVRWESSYLGPYSGWTRVLHPKPYRPVPYDVRVHSPSLDLPTLHSPSEVHSCRRETEVPKEQGTPLRTGLIPGDFTPWVPRPENGSRLLPHFSRDEVIGPTEGSRCHPTWVLRQSSVIPLVLSFWGKVSGTRSQVPVLGSIPYLRILISVYLLPGPEVLRHVHSPMTTGPTKWTAASRLSGCM